MRTQAMQLFGTILITGIVYFLIKLAQAGIHAALPIH